MHTLGYKFKLIMEKIFLRGIIFLRNSENHLRINFSFINKTIKSIFR